MHSMSNKKISHINCPISLAKPIIPVLSSEGHLYDFYSLGKWIISQRSAIGPVTKSQIKNITLIRCDDIDIEKIDNKIKDETAVLYSKLQLCMPEIIISGIYELNGIKERVDNFIKPFLNKYGTPASSVSETLFYIGASHNDLALMRRLYQMGMNPNRRHFHNQATALHVAAQKGYVDAIEWLLSLEGVEREPRRSDNGDTPLILAAYFGQSKIIEQFLLDDKVDVNTKAYSSFNHMTALDAASSEGHFDCVKVLLQFSDVELNNSLTLAGSDDHSEIVDLLLDFTLNQLLNESSGIEKQIESNVSLTTTLNKYASALWQKLKSPDLSKINLPKNLLNDNGGINKQAYARFLHNIFISKSSYASVLVGENKPNILRKLILPASSTLFFSQSIESDINNFCGDLSKLDSGPGLKISFFNVNNIASSSSDPTTPNGIDLIAREISGASQTYSVHL